MNIEQKKYFNLLKEITISQFKIKDQSTFFGFFWSFLHPLMLLIILYSVFRFRLGETVENFGIYLLIGIIHVAYFSNATATGMRVLYSMKQLTTETVFPKELLVIGSVLSTTIEFVISMLIAVVIAYFTGINISLYIILLPLVIILEVILVLWVSIILSFLYIFIRDIQHIYQVFLRILIFITPIFYTISFLGDGIAKKIVLLNPLTYLVDYSRSLIMREEIFSIEQYLIFFLANVCLFLLSIKLFKKLEPKFAEYV